MADPNTQIDWWIAQAWQEAQGGADNDSLVVWLHENELTAISSYLILQAALSCTPEEAKEIVFGHPVWAGEEPDAELESATYTSETLEPEPEPDPSFELDDWADQVDEDVPVYGEEGYQVNPAAGAAPSGAEGLDEAGREAGMSSTPGPAFEEQSGPDQGGTTGLAGDFDTESEQPVPPSAPPPILRTPPTTPAERAARFANAFGKEPSTTEAAPTPGIESTTRQRTEPPSSDVGPAAEAGTAPAQAAPEQPQPAPAGDQMPPPLVYEPLPEIEMPPAAPTEPLFSTVQREPGPTAPLVLPAETPQPAGDALLQEKDPAAGAMDVRNATPTAEAAEHYIDETPDEVAESDMEEAPDGPLADMQAVIAHDGDQPPDLRAFPEDAQTLLHDDVADLIDEEDGALPPTGLEQEPPPLDGMAAEQVEIAEPGDIGDAVAATALEVEAADDAPCPPKKVLLDPSAEAGGDGPGAGGLDDMPLGDTPEELAEAARRLGIDFRGGSAADTYMNAEIAKTARELGISFREDGGSAAAELDETALEAQKLGISFRDTESGSDKSGKPLAVKYMPLFLGIIVIVILLLLGLTFKGSVIAWLKI